MNSDEVNALITSIEASIERRKRELDEDLQSNIVIENRIVSDRLATVPGFQKHLNQARMARMVYETQVVEDHTGHGTTTRAALHKK
jgi:hypothetical protein